jgi:hypothetical protein
VQYSYKIFVRERFTEDLSDNPSAPGCTGWRYRYACEQLATFHLLFESVKAEATVESFLKAFSSIQMFR